MVIWLSHSIHGNEASGANSSLLTAYYFAAAEGKEIEELLEKTILLIDPASVEKIITEINDQDGIDVYRLNTGDNKSVDLGSSSFQVIEKPRIAV